MHTSDRFLRFAAECQMMAKFSPSSENRAVWRGLAQRWIRCAELMDLKDSEDHNRRSLKRHLKAVHPARYKPFGQSLLPGSKTETRISHLYLRQ